MRSGRYSLRCSRITTRAEQTNFIDAVSNGNRSSPPPRSRGLLTLSRIGACQFSVALSGPFRRGVSGWVVSSPEASDICWRFLIARQSDREVETLPPRPIEDCWQRCHRLTLCQKLTSMVLRLEHQNLINRRRLVFLSSSCHSSDAKTPSTALVAMPSPSPLPRELM
jgi:hypothetical protein